MVTVKQLKENGFDILDIDMCRAINSCSRFEYEHLSPTNYDSELVIEDLAWRKNTRAQPVDDDCLVEVRFPHGVIGEYRADKLKWDSQFKYWKPSLKHLEQQMNDNQETKTALEMSERDMCDVVESEWVNGDECVYVNDKETIYTYVGMHPHGDGHYIFNDEKGITYVANGYIHEPLTPEQKKANEIMAWEGFFHEVSLTEIAGILVDNNILAPEKYRKQ